MSRLSPIGRIRRFVGTLFIDPLSVKELSGIARRWQTYVGRGLYIALIGSIVWIFWTNLTRAGGWMSPSAYAELGHELFYSFFALQMAVVTFGGMSAASDMINREIRGGTLGLLALTPLTPWRIVAGKWKAALIQTSTALLCGAPVFAVCAYLGGVGLWELAYSLTLSLISAALAAGVALFCSTLFRAGYVVTIVSFVSLLVYCIAPMLLLGVLRHNEEWCMSLLCYTHPLFAAVGAAMKGRFGTPMAWEYGWMGATLTTSVLIYVLLRISVSRVRLLIRRPGGRAPEPPSLDHLKRVPVWVGPRISKVARFLRGRAGVWERNAILWKELSTRRFGAGKASRVGAVCLAFLLLTTVISNGGWRVTVLWFSSLVLLLVALANGVSLFVTEREERKWEILLTTPLRASEIVLAKLLAGLAGLVPISLIMACFWALMAYGWKISLRAMVMTQVALALMVLFTYVLAAFTSLNARTQRAAFTSAFGILIGLLCVVPVLAFMMQSYDILPRDLNLADFITGSTNPGTYLALVSDPLARSGDWYGWHDRSRERELVPTFAIYGVTYSALIGGLVLWMIHRFDRAAGRS